MSVRRQNFVRRQKVFFDSLIRRKKKKVDSATESSLGDFIRVDDF